MRRFVSSFLLAATVMFAAQLPRKAPEFVIENPDGKQLLLSSYKDKPVVLAFMFTTCQHCQHLAPMLSKIQADYAPKGVQVLGATFNPGAAFQVQTFNKAFGVTFPCGYSNPKAVNDFIQQPPDQPPFVPILIFIDHGTIRSQYVGDEKFLSNPDANIRAEIEKQLLKSASARK